MTKKAIVITMGDPSGIGPEIISKALATETVAHGFDFIIVGIRTVFDTLPEFEKIKARKNICFVDEKNDEKAAFRCLKTAVELIKAGTAGALVTAPVSKENMVKAGFKFPGHTEYLCDVFGVKKYAMMLFHKRLRVVLTTTHVPLRDVFARLTVPSIVDKLELTSCSLREQFCIEQPRIAVCGLNPHAGENGLLGDEEETTIAPAIETFLKNNRLVPVTVDGPLAADTVFYRALAGAYDAVLCHYHDQGLIPLKTTGFNEGVNLTLGLPFVRTSPDHGTAFEIAGRGTADPRSMIAAIQVAKRLT